MAGNTPFAPSGTATLAASSTTGSVILPTYGSVVEIQNAGTVTAFVAFGTSSITAAVATSYPVLAGMSKLVGIGDGVTHAAAVTSSGTPTLYLSRGEGM